MDQLPNLVRTSGPTVTETYGCAIHSRESDTPSESPFFGSKHRRCHIWALLLSDKSFYRSNHTEFSSRPGFDSVSSGVSLSLTSVFSCGFY